MFPEVEWNHRPFTRNPYEYTEVQSSMVASMRLLDGLFFRFVLPKRDPNTLHRTINMSRSPYEEEPHPERPTILGE